MGKVTLVGAGPGDAGLITVKGLEKLKNCDVVIYDRLSSDELLNAVKEDCVLVYVGKKPGAHSMKQEEINRILVEYGRKYANVVRLKGGDSFVFGRGGEEILALQEAGISYEVVPGITSSIAVPEMAGIPVTHRGIARSFHVITGHTKGDSENALQAGNEGNAEGGAPADVVRVEAVRAEAGTDTLTDDYETLAKLRGTLVFLMGLSNLEKITEQLLCYGKAPDTPAAVIANGTTPYEKVVQGTLSDIAERVRAAGLESPVVIVIGETAALRFKMEKHSPVQRLGMVGTARTMEAFCRALQGKADAVPLIEMQVCGTEHIAGLEREIVHILDYDWILFTSKQAVDTFFQVFYGQKADVRALGNCRFGVIGQGTYQALAEYGIHADFMPEQADAESFARQFAGQYARQYAGQYAGHIAGAKKETPGAQDAPEQGRRQPLRVLIPRAKQGNPALGEILRDAGMEVCELPVYDVVSRSSENFSQAGHLKKFVFFSASGVRAFFAELAERNMSLPPGSRCYCIGQQTKRALEQASNGDTEAAHAVIITADVQTVEGLAEKIMQTP